MRVNIQLRQKLNQFKTAVQRKNTPTLDEETVTWAYRLFLDREPESPVVVAEKAARLDGTQALRQEFLTSNEYRSKNDLQVGPSLTGDEPPMNIQPVQSEAELQALFKHVQETWQHLGETEPHWSVLTSKLYLQANIEANQDLFYATGERDAERLFQTLARVGIDPRGYRSCLEYGCGLGRVTRWLGERFETVYGYDISQSHLEGAAHYLSRLGMKNIQLRHLRTVQDLADLPTVDAIYSIIVLQHNPPPIIDVILRSFLRALAPGGVAFFQVPTYRKDYTFSLAEYMRNEGAALEMEMHVLPQRRVFEIVADEGGRVVEALEDSWTGGRYKEVSNTFLVQKV